MKVLVIGAGGREHALAWKLAQSPRVTEVLVAPGNAGTALEPKCRNAAVAATDIAGLVALARAEGAGLTVVGPEGPLVAGVVDAFEAAGLASSGRAGRRPARGQQGVRQGFPGAPRHPDRALRRVHARDLRSRGDPRAAPADRGQGRRPRRGQGRDRRRKRRRSHPGGRGHARGRLRRRRPRGRRRGIPRRRGSELHRHGRRRARAAARDLAGPQAPRRRRHRPQHRRHGRVFAGAGGHAGSASRGSCARSSTRRSRAWPRTACPSPASSTPG